MSKVALVTGGGRGLGRVMAIALLRAGHDVVLASTDSQALEEAISEAGDTPGRAKSIPVDLAKRGEAERLAADAVAAFGRIDMLINNAGIAINAVAKDYINTPYRFWQSDRETMERFFAINAVSPMLLANLLVPSMIERGWGRIICNTTSLSTMLRFPLYGGSKAALEAETAVMSADLVGTGVTANIFVPGGGTASRMTDEVGLPRETVFPDTIMAAPTLFLASAASDDFNGRRLLAARWDENVPLAQAAADASDPIAWTGLGVAPRHTRKW